MSQEDILIDLEEALNRLSDGLNAVKLMVLGLDSLQSASAGGFHVVCGYLDEAGEEVQRLFKAVSAARTTA